MSGLGPRKLTDPKPQIGQALQRPVISPDGGFFAVITPDLEIRIISLAQVCPGSRVRNRIVLPRKARGFLPQCHIMKWSPETILQGAFNDDSTHTTSEVVFGTTWLALSDGDRVIVVSTDLSHSRLMEHDGKYAEGEGSNILADFEIGKQYGKITLLDFVFSHRHIVILFEMCTQASIISLTKFRRDDVLLPKFSDARSFSQSPQSRHFALLTRSNGQDQVSVFSLSDDASDKVQTFNTHTFDAQGIRWCPDGDPLLAVWDSASYDLKIVFFTALGHHLRHLDIASPDLTNDLGIILSDDLGVFRFEWLYRDGKTILTVAGLKNALIYEQRSKASTPILLASYDHSSAIEPYIYPVWQESSTPQRNFSRLHTALEAMPNDGVSGVEKVAVNVDCTMIATKDSTRPRTVWIWATASSIPQTVINFREPVKQIVWHPTLPNVLLVITNQKEPTVYVWRDQSTAPAIGIVPLPVGGKGSARFEGNWLANAVGGRHLFMLSSPEAFDIGFLQGRSDGVFFESVLEREFLLEEPPDAALDNELTPSRPKGKFMIEAALGLTTDTGDTISSSTKDMKW